MVSQRCLKTRQAAHYLNIGVKRLRELTFLGELKFIKGKGKTSPLLYDVYELDRYVNENQTACEQVKPKEKNNGRVRRKAG
jgi:hypothetical protein